MNVESDEDTMTEQAAYPTSAKGSVFAAVGASHPVYKKIVKIETDANGNVVSSVVQDYKLVQELSALIESALLESADDDDTPEQQRMLMSAWQALAMYLASCDDEDKGAAAIALKQVSDLMAGTSGGSGPFPEGTFGKMVQTAEMTGNSKTVYECALCPGNRKFSTMSGLVSHLQSMHNMNPAQAQAKAMKSGGA